MRGTLRPIEADEDRARDLVEFRAGVHAETTLRSDAARWRTIVKVFRRWGLELFPPYALDSGCIGRHVEGR